MIHLITNKKEKIVYTTWVLKLNKDKRLKNTRAGEKIYYNFFTTFPQELYEFLDINDNRIYLVKSNSKKEDVILTDTEPDLPVVYRKTKLIIRRKQKNKEQTIPTSSFTLSPKLFSNLANAEEVHFKLNPRTKDIYRNKLGIISIKTI